MYGERPRGPARRSKLIGARDCRAFDGGLDFVLDPLVAYLSPDAPGALWRINLQPAQLRKPREYLDCVFDDLPYVPDVAPPRPGLADRSCDARYGRRQKTDDHAGHGSLHDLIH